MNKITTIITATAITLALAAPASAGKTCVVKTDESGIQITNNNCAPFEGIAGKDGTNGTDGADGRDGADAVAPLGSLSFTAASESFYGDGIGFGLSNSTYGSLEGSIVVGFDLNSDWRMVGGITTDFNNRTAVSVGLGYSF